jgi:type IV pilus assembly protein PilX
MRPRRAQRGVTLMMVLMFMVALTLLGIGVISSTTTEEKMGQNARDQDVALEAAEAALRDARIRITGVSQNPVVAVDLTAFDAACTSGLCINATQPVYSNYSMSAAPSAAIGTGTTSPTMVGVSAQPRYFIERIRMAIPGYADPVNVYRITAMGYGRSSDTQVLVQELVKID